MTNNPEINGRIEIAVCETQPITAEGLRRVLQNSGVYHLLEPAASLEEALRQAVSSSPRVIVADKAFGFPALLEWLPRLRSRTQSSAVIWGNSLTEAEALRLLKAGAKGIVRKTAPVESLLACLDGVVNGTTWMEEALFRERPRYERRSQTDLTAREQQVLELVEQGLRNRDIADRLGIRPGTVKIHLKHIFEKTGIRGRYGLALAVLKNRPTAAPVPM